MRNGSNPLPSRGKEGGLVASDLRPQRPELVLKDLITARVNEHRWVMHCCVCFPPSPHGCCPCLARMSSAPGTAPGR